MRRGDLVTVAAPSDFAKQCLALIIQSDRFKNTGTVTVLLLSGTLVDAPLIRVPISPGPSNRLQKPSQVMIDKMMPVKREQIGEAFGRLDDETLLSVTRSLAVFLAIA